MFRQYLHPFFPAKFRKIYLGTHAAIQKIRPNITRWTLWELTWLWPGNRPSMVNGKLFFVVHGRRLLFISHFMQHI